jgi:hypothetical protein
MLVVSGRRLAAFPVIEGRYAASLSDRFSGAARQGQVTI